MTKENFIEIIQKWVKSGISNPDLRKKTHPEIVAMNIGRAYNSVIYSTYKVNDSDCDLFAKQYVVQVKQNPVTKRYYFDMPVHTVQLPNNRQVRFLEFLDPDICQKERNPMPFIYLPVSSINRVYNSDVAATFSFIGFSVLTNVVELFQWPASYFTSTDDMKLLATILPAFESFDDGDEIHIPSGKDVEVYNVLLQILGVQRPTDPVMDGNPKSL